MNFGVLHRFVALVLIRPMDSVGVLKGEVSTLTCTDLQSLVYVGPSRIKQAPCSGQC